MDRFIYVFYWPKNSFLIEKENPSLPDEFKYAVTREPRKNFWEHIKKVFQNVSAHNL